MCNTLWTATSFNPFISFFDSSSAHGPFVLISCTEGVHQWKFSIRDVIKKKRSVYRILSLLKSNFESLRSRKTNGLPKLKILYWKYRHMFSMGSTFSFKAKDFFEVFRWSNTELPNSETCREIGFPLNLWIYFSLPCLQGFFFCQFPSQSIFVVSFR